MNDDTRSLLTQASTALIRYPRFKALHTDIRECQELSRLTHEPQCMSLEGVTGAGKSTLVRDYVALFPRRRTNRTARASRSSMPRRPRRSRSRAWPPVCWPTWAIPRPTMAHCGP